MTLFASTALFRRDGKLMVRPARKEASQELTQSKKSAARHWCSVISGLDTIDKVFVISATSSTVHVSERHFKGTGRNKWVSFSLTMSQALKHVHVSICLTELGIDPTKAPPELPDIIEINGAIYRREI